MSVFKHRAVMLDAARVIQRPAYFRFLLPWLKEWGYNVVHLHLTDDHGCALVFPSHPELASRGAMSLKQMRALVEDAARLGLEMIPELETFGHTRFITQHPRHRHLGAPDATDFAAIDPDNPHTRALLQELIGDLAALFPSGILHAGLDEVNLSALERYRQATPDDLRQAFARHAAWVHDAIRAAGKRPAMWGDHLLSTPALANAIQRDVLIFDWHYHGDFLPTSLEFFCREGFEVWGAPSTLWWGSSGHANEDNLMNLRGFTAAAMDFRERGVTGMVNTVWCPWRTLSGAMDWPICLAGHLFSAEEEYPNRCREFCREFFGLHAVDARRCAEAIERLHRLMPRRNFRIAVFGELQHRTFNREDRRLGGLVADEAEAISHRLSGLLPRAKRNADHLNDILLTARVAQRIGLFAKAGRVKTALPPGKELYRACAASWRRDRLGSWKVPREDDNLMTILRTLG